MEKQNQEVVLGLLIKKVDDLEKRIEYLEQNLEKPQNDMDFIDKLGLDEEQTKAMKMMMALGMEKSDIKDLIIKSINND